MLLSSCNKKYSLCYRGLTVVLNEIVERKGNSHVWIRVHDYIDRQNSKRGPSIHPQVQAFVTLFVTINDRKLKVPPEKSDFFKDALKFIEHFFFCDLSTNADVSV